MTRSTRLPATSSLAPSLAPLAALLVIAAMLLPAPAEASNRQLACQTARLRADARHTNDSAKCRAAYYKARSRGASSSQANSAATACRDAARARFDAEVAVADAKAARDGGCRGADPGVFTRAAAIVTATESALYYAYTFTPTPDPIGEKAHKIAAALARSLYAVEAADLRKRDDARRSAKSAKALASYQRALDALAKQAAKQGTPFDLHDFQSAPSDIARGVEHAAHLAGTRALESLAMGLVAHWSFDASAPGANRSPSGGGTALDLTFHGNAGVSPGLFGESLTLDGNGDYARVASAAGTKALEAKGALTIAAWFRATGPGSSAGAGGIIVNKEGEYEIARFPDGRPQFAIAAPGRFWTWSVAGDVAPLQVWKLVVLEVEAGSVSVHYLQSGSIITSFLSTFPFGDAHPGEDEFRIGGRQNQPQFFQGQIDEVSVWNRPLERDEIAALYNGGRGMPLAWGLGG